MRWALIKRKVLNAGAIGISYVKLLPDLFRLGKNSIVIDCGANVGHISRLFGRTGATVYAFEPDPAAYDRLIKRCGKKKNIICIQKGVWDKDATIQLYTHKDALEDETSFTVGSSIVAEKVNVDTQKARTIEVVDLVAFMEKLGRPADLVKLDVEGAEIEILKRIIATNAWNLFGRMYVETHETKIPSQTRDLEEIKMHLREKDIKNIKLNWV